MIIPNIWENKKWQPNHQPVYESTCESMENPNGFDHGTSKLQAFAPARGRLLAETGPINGMFAML